MHVFHIFPSSRRTPIVILGNSYNSSVDHDFGSSRAIRTSAGLSLTAEISQNDPYQNERDRAQLDAVDALEAPALSPMGTRPPRLVLASPSAAAISVSACGASWRSASRSRGDIGEPPSLSDSKQLIEPGLKPDQIEPCDKYEFCHWRQAPPKAL